MTLAEHRKDRPQPEGAHEEAHEPGGHEHPGALEYIQIGLVLAVITAVEVGIYYIDMSHDLLVVLLIVLSAIKFSMVVLWFMHLKFNNNLFSRLFAGGLALTFAIFTVALATVGGKLI